MPVCKAITMFVVAGLLVGCGWCGPAAAQLFTDPRSLTLGSSVTVDEADASLRTHRERGEALLKDGQWEEAVETLRRWQETYGDKLARVDANQPGGYARYLPVRELGDIELARWAATAPAALALYRERSDPLAARWLQEAQVQRDPARLGPMLEQFAMSSVGDEALLAAGDAALERGEFTAARNAYERLHPLFRWPEQPPAEVGGRPGLCLFMALRGVDLPQHWTRLEPVLKNATLPATWPVYPDASIPPADVLARLALVSILEGHVERAALELDLLERLYPRAEGKIAGKQGPYSATLRELLAASRSWPNATPSNDWPTFAGSPTRTGKAARSVDPAGKPLWSVSLGGLKGDSDHVALGRPRVAEHLKELLSYHPVVVQNRVFLVDCQERRTLVRAIDLATGEPAWPRASQSVPGEIYPASANPTGAFDLPPRVLGVPRFTSTVQGRYLFARLGAPGFGIEGEPQSASSGQIVGLDLAAQGRLLPGFPLRPGDAKWSFEGTPVCDDGSLYVALRMAGNQQQLHVAAYDIHSGQQRWRRFVAAADSPGKGVYPELRHTLLTLHEGVLYVNSNLGVIAAISTAEGHARWVVAYPRAATSLERGAAHWQRDLNPCLVGDGLVVAMPSDSERIFALDAQSGRLLWETVPPDATSGFDAVHLLGLSRGYVIASGRTLWWINAQSGALAARFPAQGSQDPELAAPSPEAFGRGLLAGDEVWWPTRERIYIFDQKPAAPGQPRQVRAPLDLVARGARGGNLVLSGEYLLVASSDRLYVFHETRVAEKIKDE